MNYEIIGMAVLGAAVLGVYYLYDWLVRKWLGIETYGMPMPAPMRWTMFFGAISTVFVLVWVVVTILGRHWVV